MKARVRHFIEQARDFDEPAFEAMALELFAWQFQRNADYSAFCDGARPRRWAEIPAVPVELFKDLDLCCYADAAVVFRTSGTTSGRRGVHRMLDTELYDLGARRWAEACMGPLPARGVALVPTAPDSSLGHMCHGFVRDMPSFFSASGGVDRAGAWAALRAATEPVFVPGTAFAFAELLVEEAAPCPLPDGSIVMVTGGYKGREMSVPEDQLHARLAEALPGARLVGEYGMTELSSQLWSIPLGTAFRPPPWLRVIAVDPWSGAPARHGLLRFVDLANHQSVVAIETRDMGTVHEDGSVTLDGRLTGSEARGCSLSVEEALDGR